MRISIGAGLAALFAFSAAASAQTASFKPSLTSDGHPDLQGFWSSHVVTTLERPDGIAGLIVTPEQAQELIAKANETEGEVRDPEDDLEVIKGVQLLEMNGELRSSLIVEPTDGKLPLTALSRAARARRADLRTTGFDNPEERPVGERCVGGPGDPPQLYVSDVYPNQIVQTPDGIIIGTEHVHGGRIIDMSGRALPNAMRSRDGYSAGHWEGDTLVVETDHLDATDPGGIQSRGGAPVSGGSRIIERFQLISADEILYRFTADDPALYSVPWLAEVVLKRAKGPIYEFACHGANYALTNVLQSARLGRQGSARPAKPN